MKDRITLTALCEMVGDAISIHMDDTYWVSAEVAALSEKNGHGYLELIEQNARGVAAAKMRATCWANVWTMLSAYFAQETGSQLQVGMQVLVEVEVNFHPVFGLSANILNIDPTFTLGDLAKQRQETINRLQQEGVMDMNKALTLPTITRRIAVISAASAAGYEDFVHQLQQGGFIFDTCLFAAIMQGDHAPASIIAALDTIAAQGEEWDAVAIIRGGGATTDLTCFDDYNLCNHCAQFPLPILSGIGHTKDVSILDMVAHTALKTPTAVAQWLVSLRDTQYQLLQDWRRRLLQTADRQIMIRRHRLEMLAQTIRMHSPERIFQMGYSLTLCRGKVVRQASQVKAGEEVEVKLQKGSLRLKAK